MAYANTVTLTHLGGPDYKLVISETDAGAATEATITGLPKKGRIHTQLATKTTGSATTIAPILTTASGSSAAVETVVQATAAADQSNAYDSPVKYQVDDGTLYSRSVCDTGSNSSITLVYFISAGW